MNVVKRIVCARRLVLHSGAWALVMVDKGERSAMLMTAAPKPLKGERSADHVEKLTWWVERLENTIRSDYQQHLD